MSPVPHAHEGRAGVDAAHLFDEDDVFGGAEIRAAVFFRPGGDCPAPVRHAVQPELYVGILNFDPGAAGGNLAFSPGAVGAVRLEPGTGFAAECC